MGKLPDPQRLKCVHCHSTETPLWRTGPDGPKSLCNACGVRYKKGKLVLYKDEEGKLTAVKLQDSLPVHVPPPVKKVLKKSCQPPVSGISQSPLEVTAKRAVKKVPSESSLQSAAVAKKPRSRARRVNAGQLPGRYASSQLSHDSSHFNWRSTTDSGESAPSSPADSPRLSDRSTTFMTASSSFVTDEYNPVHRGSFSDEDRLFSDMAGLGLDGSVDPDNNTLLSLPADPSSAEQFTFAFSGLGQDAHLALDAPDRAEALRALLLDRTRKVSTLYDLTVQAICRLYEYRLHNHNISGTSTDRYSIGEDCKSFVRSFARLDNTSTPFGSTISCSDSGFEVNIPPIMLTEKTLHSAAFERLRALMDSTELFGFAETCLVELVGEEVSSAVSHRALSDFEKGERFSLDRSKTSRAESISTPA